MYRIAIGAAPSYAENSRYPSRSTVEDVADLRAPLAALNIPL